MQGYITVTAIGHLVNPESRQVQTKNGDQHVLSWSMAFNDPNDRQNQEKTTWVRCAVWGRGADIIEEFCCETDQPSGRLVSKKGAAVAVTGTLQVQKWTSRNGERGQTVQINVNQFSLMNERSNGETSETTPPRPAGPSRPRAQQQPEPAAEPINLDELPF